MAKNYFENLRKINKYATISSEGTIADCNTFTDTGSYALNALISGSIYKGLNDNLVLGLSGLSATGKTYFALSIVGAFLEKDEDARVIVFDTEAAVTTKMLEERGLPTDRIMIFPICSIEEFSNQMMNILDAHMSLTEKERPKTLIVLDSLGMLSTNKEMTDIKDGKDTQDMTRAKKIKAAFRVLDIKLAQAKIPLIVNNHVYMSMSLYPEAVLAGGNGMSYAADIILMLSKSKDKVGTDVVGSIIGCKTFKSRATKENKKIEVRLHYDKGLDRYYGLLDIAAKYGLITKVANKYEFPNGEKAFESAIYKNPEKWFTKDFLDKIDKECEKEFCYGKGTDDVVSDEEIETEE